MAFELPPDLKTEFNVDLTLEAKKKILGLNAARLYGLDIEAQKRKIQNDELAQKARQMQAAKPADTMESTSISV